MSFVKLNEVKPGIKLKTENQKKIDASAKATAEINNKIKKIPHNTDSVGNKKHYRYCEMLEFKQQYSEFPMDIQRATSAPASCLDYISQSFSL